MSFFWDTPTVIVHFTHLALSKCSLNFLVNALFLQLDVRSLEDGAML